MADLNTEASCSKTASSLEASNCESIENETPLELELLDLNDDCFEEIFKYLELPDQLHLARTCDRLSNLFVTFYKSEYKSVDLPMIFLDEMELWEVKDFFNLLGPYITEISGKPSGRFMIRACKNVKRLSISSRSVDLDFLDFVISVMRSIVDLTLHRCELFDHYILQLRKLRSLTKLDLSSNSCLLGTHIEKLSKTVEVVNLFRCHNLKIQSVVSLCKSLINLKELDFRNCFLDPFDIDLSEHCANLELLKINPNIGHFKPFSKAPKLKHLVIMKRCVQLGKCYKSHLSRIISELIAHKAEQVECLELIGDYRPHEMQHISQLHALRQLKLLGRFERKVLKYFCGMPNLEEILLWYCKYIDNAAVMRLVLSCKKLQCIHLTHCALISEELVFDLIKEIRAQIESKERQHPIELIVFRTEIEDYILDHPEYLAANNILRLVFKDSTTHFRVHNLRFGPKGQPDVYCPSALY